MRDGVPTVMIVDDEALARARMHDLLNDSSGWLIVAEAANGRQALDLYQEQRPDVVLLDIRMPEMDGLEVARHLAALPAPPAVIFTTAYDEYAVKAFDTHAVGYLLKPVRRERLLPALEHAARLSRAQLSALAEAQQITAARQNIPVRQAGNIRLIPVTSILSFQADQKYVRMVFVTDAGSGQMTRQEALIDEPLKALETEFADDFARIHRNSLIRMNAIDSLERDADGHCLLTLRGCSEKLPVSRRHAARVKHLLIT
jgi:two-component system response regulator AlgR